MVNTNCSIRRMRFIFLLKGRLCLIKSACSQPMGLGFKSAQLPGGGKLSTHVMLQDGLVAGHIYGLTFMGGGDDTGHSDDCILELCSCN